MSSPSFATMRVRDLRLYLIRAGVAEKVVNQMLDKKELIAMAQSIVDTDLWWGNVHRMFCTVLIGLLVLVIIRYRHQIHNAIMSVADWVSDRLYPLRKRFRHLSEAYLRGSTLALCLHLLCLVADVYSMYLSCSSVATWILPHSSPMRQYLAPALYIPLSFPSSGGNRFDTSSFSLNVGPMVTLSIVRFITYRIHRYAQNVLRRSRRMQKSTLKDDQVPTHEDPVFELRKKR